MGGACAADDPWQATAKNFAYSSGKPTPAKGTRLQDAWVARATRRGTIHGAPRATSTRAGSTIIAPSSTSPLPRWSSRPLERRRHVSRGCPHAQAQDKPSLSAEEQESLTAAAPFEALAAASRL
jgi:hypothetical protein